MLFYTGGDRAAAAILNAQRQRTRANTQTLLRLKAIVGEAEQMLGAAGPLAPFGNLLHEAWQLKKSLAAGIATPLVDEAYAAALRAGATGGKLLGAGGQGFLLLFAAPDRHPAVRAALRELREVPLAFGNDGSQIIFRTTDQ